MKQKITTGHRKTPQTDRVEWPTLALFVLCILLLGVAIWVLSNFSLWVAMPAVIFALVLHASLTHEVCHGHPIPSRRYAELLVHLNPGLAVPYLRFRDTHLAHHQDSILTDPYDDPESNYLDPVVWANMPRWAQTLRRANNTLAGRITLGPFLGQLAFMADDWKLVRAGNGGVLKAWLLHMPLVALTLWGVMLSPTPLWFYLMCCYVALGILRIRTFLEHQAHEKARGRTVIIEDRGVLAFLFLNNNLHVVHHMHPRVPWYRLPALYAKNKARYVASNDGYVYRSYGEIFRYFFWRAKDPVPHPLWSSPDK